MVNIVISGISGRMGSTIKDLAESDPDINLAGGIEKPGNKKYPHNLEGIIDRMDVLIDFSTVSAALGNLHIVHKNRKAAVIGVTGFTEDEIAEIDTLSKDIPCVISPNMSPGVNIMFDAAEDISRRLKKYDTEIIEAHHIHKKDAPSGTAKRLAEAVRKGARRKDVKTHSVRAGEIVGEHRIIWAGPGEVLELVHTALSRTAFAAGAIKAAKFAVQAKPGKYTMKDVLDI